MAKRAKRVYRSKSFYGKVATLFPKSQKTMSAQIARVVVLSEDLKMEALGSLREKTFLDFFDAPEYRRFYFVRRAMLTFRELHSALSQLDRDSDFQRIKARMNTVNKRGWKDAVAFFDQHAPAIAKARNVTGGHFSNKAGEHAVDEVSGDLVGKVEVIWKPKETRVNLHFAYDVMVLGLIQPRAVGQKEVDYLREFFETLGAAYSHAARAMHAVTLTYIIPKFRGTY